MPKGVRSVLHAFCQTHRLAYRVDFDPTCPQCTLARIVPAPQLGVDIAFQKPVNAANDLLDPITLLPVA